VPLRYCCFACCNLSQSALAESFSAETAPSENIMQVTMTTD